MILSRAWPALLFTAGLFLMVGGSSAQLPQLGQPKVVQVPGQPAPVAQGRGELPVVPKTAAAFISVKVSDLVEHPDLKPVLEQLKKTPDALDGVTEMIGVLPHEIDRVTLFWPAIGGARAGLAGWRSAHPRGVQRGPRAKSLGAEPVFDLDWQRRWAGLRPDHDYDWGKATARCPRSSTQRRSWSLNPPKLSDPRSSTKAAG